MNDMAIAAMSVDMHQNQVQRDFGIGVMKMAMDAGTESMDKMLDGLEEAVSVDPNLGANVDILA